MQNHKNKLKKILKLGLSFKRLIYPEQVFAKTNKRNIVLLLPLKKYTFNRIFISFFGIKYATELHIELNIKKIVKRFYFGILSKTAQLYSSSLLQYPKKTKR